MVTKKKVPITLKWNNEISEWVAVSTSGARLSGHGPTPRNARSAIGRVLSEHYQTAVDTEPTTELPPTIRQKLAQLETKKEQLRKLTEEVPALRAEIAKDLVRDYNYSQVDAAEVVGWTQGYVNKLIMRSGTEPHAASSGTRKRRP